MSRPAIVIVHFVGSTALDGSASDRLDTVGRLLDRKPLHYWDDPPTQEPPKEPPGETEMIAGRRSRPLFRTGFFKNAPNPHLFARGAGSAKQYATGELQEQRSLATSSADANAEPPQRRTSRQ